MLTVEILVFGFTFWLGCYLYGRNPADQRLQFTAWGLLTYALGLGGSALVHYTDTAAWLLRFTWPLFFLPPLFWFGAIVLLLPDDSRLRARLEMSTRYGLYPTAGLVYLLVVGTRWFFVDNRPQSGYAILAAAVAALLMGALSLVLAAYRRTQSDDRPVGLALLATLFFALSMGGLLLFPLGWLPRALTVLGVGADLIFLGLVIAFFDAFESGEALRPDLLRSLVASSFVALIFGGQIAFAMRIGPGLTATMLALLLAVITAAILIQTFADQLQTLLDRLVFARFPQLQQTRADLRAAASAAPRVHPALDVATLQEAEFARLTRRALSHLSNLPKLASSPLTRLPLIEARLEERGARLGTLERAKELRALLIESIGRLKPRGSENFGATDEWRYYNALYYPYVVGLKPYSRRNHYHDLDDDAEAALAWFRRQVPERTLYNWQKKAAQLIARDLREKHQLADPNEIMEK